MKTLLAAALLASASALSVAGVARADDATNAQQAVSKAETQKAGGTPEASNGPQIEQVVVTARRREELAQHVPIAIQAATGEQLRVLGVLRPEDLKQIAPGLVVIPSSFGDSVPSYIIRGQQQGNLWLTADSPVTTYFAEVPLGRFQGSSGGLFDLANVQVLKGPQGTLFGRNTTGGAILIVPQAPTADYGGYADVSYGDYNALHAEGAINVPVSDQLQVRVAGTLTRHDGYTQNLAGPRLDDENIESVRFSMAYQPMEWLSNQLVVNAYHEDEAPVGFKLVAVNPTGLFATIFPSAVDIPKSYTDFHETSLNSPTPPFGFNTHVSTATVSDITEADLGNDMVAKNILGYHSVSLYTFNDFDGSSLPLIDSRELMHSSQWNDEVQLQGDLLDEHLKYTVGAFYFVEAGNDFQYVSLFGGSVQNAGGGRNVTNQSEAVYAQATYSFDDPAVSITLGARYSWDQRSLDFAAKLFNGPCLIYTTDTGNTLASPCSVPGSASFSKPTYNATVNWNPVENWMLYVSYNTGYHSGGFDLNATRPGEMVPVKPETVAQVELGSKLDWQWNLLAGRFNLALYHDDFKDVQKLVSVVKANDTFQTLLENAAEETIQGIEGDVLFHVGDALDLSASYAYVDAHYVSYISPSQGDLSHNQVGSVIPNAGTAGVVWHIPFPRRIGLLDFRADTYWESSYPSSDINVDPVTKRKIHTGDIPAYWTENLRLGLNDLYGSGWDVDAYVRNVFDKKYYVNGVDFYSSLGSTAEILGPPRTFGIEARVAF